MIGKKEKVLTMRSHLFRIFVGMVCLGAFLAITAPEADAVPPLVPSPDPPIGGKLEEAPLPEQPGVEVQARGPVHEAFAEPTDSRPAPGLIVTKEPPARVEEMPPEDKPEGDHVVWVPGYWAFDDERNDFLWISGFWRTAPPSRQWVPGNWQKVAGGWQWVAGYWGAPGREEEEYLPAPPATIDAGPSVPAPDATSTYVPGCWVYQETRYLWRPGYWVAYRPGWVWIPAHYKWTPCGYVFVAGFWDYPLCDRGLLFAPVRFERRVLLAPRFVYRPRFVVRADFLIGALFVRPRARQFYFGDYFEARYTRAGYVSWVDYRVNRVGYDANFSYYRHAFARYPTWERNLRTLYVSRYNGTVPRPPRTLVQQNVVINNFNVKRTGNVAVHKNINITNVQSVTALAPVTRVHNTHVTGLASLGGVRPAEVKKLAVTRQVRVERVSKARLVQETKAIAHYRNVSTQRGDAQAKLIVKGAATAPRKVRIESFKAAPAHTINTRSKAPPPPVRPAVVPKGHGPAKGRP
jgi:hypothetical protein